MDQLSTLLQDRWYLIVGALVVLFIVIKLVKTAIKWVLTLAILAAIIFYGANYMDDVKNKLGSQAIQVMAGSAAKDATYKKNDDGSYTVSSNGITVQGKPGSNDVKVTILGQTVTLKIDATIQAFIDQAKKAQ